MTVDGHRSITRHDGSLKESWFSYQCGFCGAEVSGAVVASTSWNYVSDFNRNELLREIRWLQCTNCGLGSVANDSNIAPGVPFGPTLEGLPDDVLSAYREARRCMRALAYTAAELLCRKILMHVAVEKGAKEGESFGA